jgi:hypothetical protein
LPITVGRGPPGRCHQHQRADATGLSARDRKRVAGSIAAGDGSRAGRPGRDEGRQERAMQRRAVGQVEPIRAPKPGRSSSTQRNPAAARRSASGWSSVRVETVLNAGRPITSPGPSPRIPACFGRRFSSVVLRAPRKPVSSVTGTRGRGAVIVRTTRPDAPEHNPDEFLNNDVKQAMGRQNIPRDKATLKSGLTSYMRGLQRRPAKLRAFFQALTVRYAA